MFCDDNKGRIRCDCVFIAADLADSISDMRVDGEAAGSDHQPLNLVPTLEHKKGKSPEETFIVVTPWSTRGQHPSDR